jgi:glycosyltransferase involved in cell wall biosynthesis
MKAAPTSTPDADGLDGVSPPPLACSAVLTHHWLVRMRGGEKVLAAIAELLPDAAIHTLVHDRSAAAIPAPSGRPMPVITSALQRLPGALRYYPHLLPLMPVAFRRMHLPAVDLVVCSDAAIAKAMTTDPRSRVVCYCHSPPRYAWEPEIRRQYAGSLSLPLRPLFKLAAERVRRADADAARRVDQFIANSRHVADRIRRHYGRHSLIIHPPVDLPPQPCRDAREDFYLCVGHHVPYKRLDLAIAACQHLGRRLVIIGDGPDVRRYAPVADNLPAKPTFLGYQPDEVVWDHYRRARGLLFPGEEDFGIVPVEAMAHGCPVIAYGVGGACETVVDGVTGVLFREQTEKSLAAAVERAEALRFDPAALHERMQRFGRARFLREMYAALTDVLAAH